MAPEEVLLTPKHKISVPKALCCGLVQVTAFSAIKANGETGTLPLGVNFQIGSNATRTTSGASAYSGVSPQVCIWDSSQELSCNAAGQLT